jgi:long-chain acyl-CoA synthetase
MHSCLTYARQFPLRPTKDIQSIVDFIRLDSDAPRTLWSTKVCLAHSTKPSSLIYASKITNLELLARVRAAAAGFMRLAKFTPEESNVLLLLNDGVGKFQTLSQHLFCS